MNPIDRRGFLGAGTGLAAGLALPALARAALHEGPLDVAYTNARVWTAQGPAHRSDAIGVVGDRIAALGKAQVAARTTAATRVVDLGGAFVTPGFTDSHVHFVIASRALTEPNLRDAANRDDFVARIAAAAKRLPKGAWMQGGAWDADRWGGELPRHDWIDAVTPDTPVAIVRYDLHMVLVNALGLRMLGLDRHTPDIAGGVIGRDANGELTGIFKDAAKDMVQARIGNPSAAATDAAVKLGIAAAVSKGVTQVHCPELDWQTFESLTRIRAEGEPGLRFYVFNPLRDWERTAEIVRTQGRGDHWLRWGASKVVLDGSLGSRTAWFYDAYLDDPKTHGILVTSPEDLAKWMPLADRAGLQVACHAIGDHANDLALDTMAAVAKANGPRDRRFRIEHAQSLTPAAIPRFGRQGVIASVQPYHAVDDGRWAVRRIGPERLKGTYAFAALLAGGAHMCFGSDWPVAPIDPLTGLKAAVLRETIDGANPHGWYPDQRMSLAQAMANYTRGAAYAGFSESWQGVLAPGMVADMAVFDRDLFAIDPETLTDAKVLRTVIGGQERYTA